MLRASPSDKRMLLERPLKEAVRLYAVQIAGIFVIALAFVGIFACALVIERPPISTHHVFQGQAVESWALVVVTVALTLGTGALGFAGGTVMGGITDRISGGAKRRANRDLILYANNDLDIAIDAFNREDLDLAKHFAIASLHKFEVLGEQGGLAEAHRILGATYLQMNDLERAYSHAETSLHYYEGSDAEGAGYALGLLGDIAQTDEKFEQAETYYRQAITQMKWSRDSYWEIVSTMLNLVIVLDALHRADESDRLRAQIWKLIEQPAQDASPMRAPFIARHAFSTIEPVKVS